MGHVIVIFGTLIALNMGFGYWLSDENADKLPQEGVVEVEQVEPAAPASDPAGAAVEATPATTE